MEAPISIITLGVKGMVLSRFHRTLWGLLILCALLVAGCDPVRTTSQPVRLKVVDLASGQPVVDAQVTLAFDLAAVDPLSKTVLPPQEWKRRVEEEKQHASRSVTNEQGQADLDVKVTAIDRTWGSKPPSNRNLTGHPFLIGVKAGEAPEEEISLVMKPGATVKGKHFAVTILAIPEPRYVKTSGNW